MKLDGPFVPGGRTTGRIAYPGYEHLAMDILVETMAPESLFSFRWHPYAVEPDADYGSEPTTLVAFRLEAAGGGTRLTVTESGFDQLPAHRRDEAYRMNDGGWAQQLVNVERHVSA